MSDWFRRQPKIGTSRLPNAPMPPLPMVPAPAAPVAPAAATAPAAWARSSTPTQLPANMQTTSARVVMQHFARSEVRHLGKREAELHAQVVAKLRGMYEFVNMTDAQLADVIKNMARALQSAQLTINFPTVGWFDRPNHYRVYKQMYERGDEVVTADDGARERIIKGNASNPAGTRDKVDAKVSFAPNVDTPGMQGVKRFMHTGNGELRGKSVLVSNAQFNSKARQIFAALNYGRRTGGCSTHYGPHYFVLKERFKHNAIYYMGDTFTPGMDHNSRVTYGFLPALILHATKDGLQDLINACYRSMTMQNTDRADLMVEAHIYDRIVFSEAVEEMVINRRKFHEDIRSQIYLAGRTDITEEQAVNNVKIFANVNRIRINWQDN
ncbi:hypothetical protein EJV46_20535 [Roseococcus sp. SYP-B2431]|uniref:hypothetical protein n=1 Tax=Roseococcus sp. SYP-B2431 TaxID=2496640 RepID=UPI0010399A7F|nr:hypothetical protein [Roseococcus sp. SYP-B2431]TCH96370.1 hypothetical protein EJV46_20535 [Roseococcus sp. SYP-B2431]